MPRVSVIVIFLNPGAYLDEAIRSIAAQTFQDWELILVDDGSVDASTGIARAWVDQLPGRATYLDHAGHANRGMSASRNLGLRGASGEYVAFLDADDVYLPERLARHVEILDRWPAVDAVQSDHVHWYCWRDRRGRYRQEICTRAPAFLGDGIVKPPDGLRTMLGVPEVFFGTCSLTIRRAAALELGGFEEPFRALYEDQVFLTKVYAHKTVYVLQDQLAMYRMHDDSTCAVEIAGASRGERSYFSAMQRLREWQAGYLEEVGKDLAEVPATVKRLLECAQDERSSRLLALRLAGGQALHRFMRRFAPSTVYGRLLRRRQSLATLTMRRRYAALCQQVATRQFRERRSELPVATAAPARVSPAQRETAEAGKWPPRVSVIIIFKDEERFLAGAVESVLAQTFPDWELLLVDDGSTDGSTALARKYAACRPDRIRCLEHPGHVQRGKSVSRNLGLQQAQGEYVTFLDGDDVYLPQRLERHMRVIDAMPDAAAVQSDLIHWHSWSGSAGRREDDYVRPRVCATDRIMPPPLALWTLVALPALSPGICSLTVTRTVALELGGFEDRFRSLFEDQVFLVKLFAAHPVYVVEDYLAGYRIHPASSMAKATASAHLASGNWQVQRREFMSWRDQYLRSLPDPSGLLGLIIAEAAAQRDAPVGGFRARATGLLRHGLETLLPPGAHARLWAGRRRAADRHTLAAYAALCRRVTQARIRP